MATKKQLLAYPMVDELEYREKTQPDKLNRMLKSIEESVLRAILKSNELVNSMNKLNLATVASYNALAAQETRFDQYPENVGNVAFATSFDPIVSETNVASGKVDNLTGILTLDWETQRKMSKVPRVNNVTSNAISIYIDNILRDKNDDVYNIFDKTNENFWIESATPGSEHILEINLPASINKKFNYIELTPIPVFGMEIQKIDYFDEQSRLIEIFPNEHNKFYNKSGPLVLHLSPRVFNNVIKIHYKVSTGSNAMGFSFVDIALIDYYNTEHIAYIPFNIPNDVLTIVPQSVELDFYVDGVTIYNSYITEVSLVAGSNIILLKAQHGIQTNFGGTTIDITEGMYLKIKFKEVNMTSPVIRGCKMNYEKV